MSEQKPSSELPLTHGSRRGLKILPAFGALTLVALSLYASQASLVPAAGKAAAKDAEQVGGDKAAMTTKAVAAAKTFLDSLDANQRAKAVYDFNSNKRSGWSNLPITNVPRNGLRMGDLTKAQRDAALGVVAAVTSKEGYQKVINIMNADEVLSKGGGGKGKGKGKGDKGGKGKGGNSSMGNDNYFLALFGTPSTTEPWLVQFGGHHLGLNVTVVDKTFVLTPTHTGVQPASVMQDGKTIRALGKENDKGFELINALNEKQRAQAIISANYINLVLGPGQDGKTIQPVGIKGSALNALQQGKLLEVIAQWVDIVNDDSAAARLAEIKAKLGDTYFGWWGPTTNGSAAYYRVQGPTVVIEYAPQGGTDHIHTIVRDPSNDYGKKLVKK